MSTVRYETDGPIAVITIDRPMVRNAVDGPTAGYLAEAFRAFDEEADSEQRLAGARAARHESGAACGESTESDFIEAWDSGGGFGYFISGSFRHGNHRQCGVSSLFPPP